MIDPARFNADAEEGAASAAPRYESERRRAVGVASGDRAPSDPDGRRTSGT